MTHLWDRLAEAKSRLAPVQSKYRVLFEDPTQPDAPAAVCNTGMVFIEVVNNFIYNPLM